MQIITHRGLEPSKPNFFSESTYEAFKDHLKRGFGIEFDVTFTKDNKIVIVHDSNLTRLFKDTGLKNGRLCFLDELLELVRDNTATINALHLKGRFQTKKHINLVLDYLNNFPAIQNKLLVFDVKPKFAEYILSKNPSLILAPSIAHKYDIKRYNKAVKGTLISIGDAIKNKDLFKWVWLDEWDLTDEDGNTKTLYNKKTFETLRDRGYKIALVTPELHSTSPGLLGGEAHPDAKPKKRLFTRIKEIIALKPDAICTDYPEETRKMILET